MPGVLLDVAFHASAVRGEGADAVDVAPGNVRILAAEVKQDRALDPVGTFEPPGIGRRASGAQLRGGFIVDRSWGRRLLGDRATLANAGAIGDVLSSNAAPSPTTRTPRSTPRRGLNMRYPDGQRSTYSAYSYSGHTDTGYWGDLP